MKYITPIDYEKAEQNGISKKVLELRVYHLKWEIERATTQKVRKHACDSDKHGYKKQKAVCEENGIDYATYVMRVRRGWSQERAASTPRMDKTKNLEKMWIARRKAN